WKYLRDKYAKEAAKVAGTERSSFGTSDVCKPKWIYFGSLRFLTVCWVDREAKGRRLLLNHLLARDVRQMADVVLINPHPFFLDREKAPKREYFTADGYHIHRILGVRKMSKLIKVHVKKKLGAQWIGVRHCLELPQIYLCSHCTLVQPLQDKRPQVVVVPELHPPPITMSTTVSASDRALVAQAQMLLTLCTHAVRCALTLLDWNRRVYMAKEQASDIQTNPEGLNPTQ
ncbi:hypothetical protein HPB47_001565, partial [Ixodes persulcatus]